MSAAGPGPVPGALCHLASPQLQPVWIFCCFGAARHRDLRLPPFLFSHLRSRRALPNLRGQEPRLQEACLRGAHQLPLQARPSSLGGGEHPAGHGDESLSLGKPGPLGTAPSCFQKLLPPPPDRAQTGATGKRGEVGGGWAVALALWQPWVTVPATQDGAGHHIAPEHRAHVSANPLFSCVTFFCRLRA